MGSPTQIRTLGNTSRFCLTDVSKLPAETIIRLVGELNTILEPSGIKLQYRNILVDDPASVAYNPDGLLGHIKVTQYR